MKMDKSFILWEVFLTQNPVNTLSGPATEVLWFLEEIKVHCAAYDCLTVVGRLKAFPSTNFKQITKEGSKA